MTTKPKFLIDIEKKIRRSLNINQLESKQKRNLHTKRIEVFRDAFLLLIDNIQTFGPLLAQIRNEYEDYIVQLKGHMKYLQVTNDQLFTEMKKFQDEISSDDEEHEKREMADNLVERIKIKREKDKQKRKRKYELHAQEIDKLNENIQEGIEQVERMKEEMKEKDKKYDMLVEEFKSVQARFAAYKAIKDEVKIQNLFSNFINP
jgi:chromosome segregation ATPase